MLDSGCSFHICPNRLLYHEYHSVDGGRVLMGNNNGCKIVDQSKLRCLMGS